MDFRHWLLLHSKQRNGQDRLADSESRRMHETELFQNRSTPSFLLVPVFGSEAPGAVQR